MSSKRKQAQDSRNAVALDKAGSLQLDKALGDVSSTSIIVQSLFGKISEELVTKHSELKAINDAIDLKKTELTDLHGKDRILLSIDDLNVEFKKEQDRITQEREEIQRELQQQDAAFEYNRNQERKAANDRWDEVVRVRERDQKIKEEEFEKLHKAKHDELKAIDLEYKSAIEKVKSFDDVVKKEVDKQVSIVSNVLKKDHAHQLEIIHIQHTSAVDRLVADSARLNDTITANNVLISSLQSQLAAAHAAQTKLASEAVSAAANQKGMADMQSLITNIGGPNGARAKS